MIKNCLILMSSNFCTKPLLFKQYPRLWLSVLCLNIAQAH